jgi:hypothetical protein
MRLGVRFGPPGWGSNLRSINWPLLTPSACGYAAGTTSAATHACHVKLATRCTQVRLDALRGASQPVEVGLEPAHDSTKRWTRAFPATTTAAVT